MSFLFFRVYYRDRFQRFLLFWCRFLVWRGRMTTLLDCFAGDIFSVVLQDAPENFNSQDFLRWRFDLDTASAFEVENLLDGVLCVHRLVEKFYMLFSSFQVAKFATSFGRWLDPSRWLINPRDFRNQDFARKLRDTAEELCQDIIDLTPVLVACQVKCAPKKPLTNMALKRQGLNFVWCKDRHIEMWAQRGSVSWNDSKAVLRFLCMLSWSQCIDLCSEGTDGWWLNWCQLWALAVQILPLLIFQFFFNAGSLIACSSIHA